MAGNAPGQALAPGDREHGAMRGQDAELELFRNGVNCAALLERLPPPWQLDRKESTRRALKYRRGAGEILIVNHGGRGWWDPLSAAKGDIFDLVQFLEPGLNFGQVRQVLRRFVGVAPTFPEALQTSKRTAVVRPPPDRWSARPRLRRGSPAWLYLTRGRGPRGQPHRNPWARLQRLVERREQDAVPPAWRAGRRPDRRHRGADRRAQ